MLGTVILIGCAGSPDTDQPAAAAPTIAQSAASAPTPSPTSDSSGPTAEAEPEPTEAASTAEPGIANSKECAPGDSIETQKAKMLDILTSQFTGETDEGRPRLQFGPDSRDHRQGGIWMVAEFNGDELESVALKKAALDRWMRDAYEALYTAGCEDLAQVDLASYQDALVKVSMMGETIPRPSIVFKTRLRRDVADTVAWAEKESLDFDEIWDTLLLNPRWRDELRESADGD
jgi:hypothetical protein